MSNINISFDVETFLYTKPITITNYNKLFKENYTSITFADKLPKYKSASLTSNIDNETLKKFTVNKNNIKFENMCLFRNLTIREVLYILAYVLNLNITNIIINIKNNIEKKNILLHEYIKYDMSKIYDTTSLGYNEIEIELVANNNNRLNYYEEIFYNNYYNIYLYVNNIINNASKLKLKELTINISEIQVSLIYDGPKQTISNINISKLFNILHINKVISKIYVQSSEIDTYVSNTRAMQYVKINKNISNEFKGVSSLYETCSVYLFKKIDNDISIHHVNICKNMTINIIFMTNNRPYDLCVSTIFDYLDKNMTKLLKKLKINECVYNIGYDYEYYKPFISSINSNITLLTKENVINNVNNIILQEVPQMKFITNTSIQFSGYMFYNTQNIYKYMYEALSHETLTNNIIYKNICPNIHIGQLDEDTIITISNASSIEEISYTLSYIIGNFTKFDIPKHVDAKDLSVDTIRKKYGKYNKGMLKKLVNIDPALFGTRKIGKYTRSFSGLCQKIKQRVVSITEDEYRFLKDQIPNSVVDIRNQTYQEQRLYLFCPYKDYSFLNYHHINNQLCIIRCTTKPCNKTQYDYCTKELDAVDTFDIQNKYENQSVTLYNPMITVGRRCKLPDEIYNSFVDYILLKLDTDNIYKYCIENYNKYPFVIKRNVNNNEYLILTDYNFNYDYVLILQSETDDKYFIFLNNNEPIILSENIELKNIIADNIRISKHQYMFFDYIKKILNININMEKNITTILNDLSTQYKIKLVCNNNILYCIIHNNVIYFTPKISYSEENNIEHLSDTIDKYKKGTYTFPDINKLNKEYITTLYKDYLTDKITIVKFCGESLFIKPTILPNNFINHDIIMVDTNTILNYIAYTNTIHKFSRINSTNKSIGYIIKNYMYIFLMEFGKITNINTIKSKLILQNIVYDNKTFINYVSKKHKDFVSWRTSKINGKDFDEYMETQFSMYTNDIIKDIYDKFCEDMTFNHSINEKIVSKIITI